MNVLNGNFSCFCNGIIFILLVVFIELKFEKKKFCKKGPKFWRLTIISFQNISNNAFTFSQSFGFCMPKLETPQPCQKANILEMNFHMNFDSFQEWLEATTSSMSQLWCKRPLWRSTKRVLRQLQLPLPQFLLYLVRKDLKHLHVIDLLCFWSETIWQEWSCFQGRSMILQNKIGGFYKWKRNKCFCLHKKSR